MTNAPITATVYIEPHRAEMDRRVFRRMSDGSLEWCHYGDWMSDGDGARFYGFASREVPEGAAEVVTGNAFRAAGFTVKQTGGGCTLWALPVGEGFEVLISDSEGTGHTLLPGLPDGDYWMIGMQSADGLYVDPVEVGDTETALAVALSFYDRIAALIAEAFTANVADEIEPHVFAAILKDNREREDVTCATHDFCDANMPMAEAFAAVMNGTVEPGNQAHADLWNKAWSIARSCYLRTLNAVDGSLDEMVRTYCAAHFIEVDGDAFGMAFAHMAENAVTSPESAMQTLDRVAREDGLFLPGINAPSDDRRPYTDPNGSTATDEPDAPEGMGMHVVLAGSPISGFQVFGPFNTAEAAHMRGMASGHDVYWIVPLRAASEL